MTFSSNQFHVWAKHFYFNRHRSNFTHPEWHSYLHLKFIKFCHINFLFYFIYFIFVFVIHLIFYKKLNKYGLTGAEEGSFKYKLNLTKFYFKNIKNKLRYFLINSK